MKFSQNNENSVYACTLGDFWENTLSWVQHHFERVLLELLPGSKCSLTVPLDCRMKFPWSSLDTLRK